MRWNTLVQVTGAGGFDGSHFADEPVNRESGLALTIRWRREHVDSYKAGIYIV